MTRYLANNCYCNGNLITEELTINQSMHLENIDVHNIDTDVLSSQSVLADDVTVDDKVVTKDLDATGNIACSGTITSLNSNCTNASALTLETSAISLSSQTVNTWQDLVTNGYINIPTAASVITEGSNVLYDDLNNSTNKIISSDPLFYGNEPYHYCKQTTWPSSLHSDYQFPVIEIQNPVADYYNPAYYDVKYHNFRMIPVKEEQTDNAYTVHDNSLLRNITNAHGKRFSYIHSDTHTPITIDNSDGDLLGIIRLYNTSDQTITYDVVVRAHSIYVNNEELAMPFNLTNVAAYGYYKKVTVAEYTYEYYPQELIVVSTSSDAGEYWNIAVIKNGEIYFTRTITEADKIDSIHEWQKYNYPCVFHFGNNDSTLMVVTKIYNTVSGRTGVTHLTLAYTQGNNVPLTRYDNGSWDYTSDSTYITTRRMRLKQYFTTDGYVVLADDWNYDSNNGENDMTYEHYNGNYPVIEVIAPANEHSFDFSPAHWFIKLSTTQSIAHNFIVKGIITFQFTSTSTSVPGNDDNHYLVVFKCDDQNYAVYSWSTGSNNDLTITTSTSLPIYNNSARFTVVYNPELPHELINRIDLCYINWNCRSPYIVYSTASPYSNPHNQYDSRTYYIAYYQLFNINHQAPSSQSSAYIIPPYLTNNVALVSDGKIYNNI